MQYGQPFSPKVASENRNSIVESNTRTPPGEKISSSGANALRVSMSLIINLAAQPFSVVREIPTTFHVHADPSGQALGKAGDEMGLSMGCDQDLDSPLLLSTLYTL